MRSPLEKTCGGTYVVLMSPREGGINSVEVPRSFATTTPIVFHLFSSAYAAGESPVPASLEFFFWYDDAPSLLVPPSETRASWNKRSLRTRVDLNRVGRKRSTRRTGTGTAADGYFAGRMTWLEGGEKNTLFRFKKRQ